MSRPHQRVYQGVRSDRHSGSKLSKRTAFHPWQSVVKETFERYLPELDAADSRPLIVVSPGHVDFVQPFTESELRESLRRVPDQFTRGIRGIFLLSGSKKQAKVAKSLFCYGTYWLWCIFLAPYPKSQMSVTYKKPPSPAFLHAYERSGAKIAESRGGLTVAFDENSLRRFYLRDVLPHEIGHHVDRYWSKSKARKEGFANWFATEFGYKLQRAI